jgi:hypothetical protein
VLLLAGKDAAAAERFAKSDPYVLTDWSSGGKCGVDDGCGGDGGGADL